MKLFFTTILALVLMPSVFGQGAGKTTGDQPPKKDAAAPDSYYRLNFSMFEVEDGKRVNQRDYSMIVRSNDGRQNTVKSSTRVPIATGTSGGDTQITYTDVGLEIDCSMLKELTDSKVAVTCDVQISNILTEQTTEGHNRLGPVLRTANARYVWAVLTPGKPSPFTTIDDVNSKKRIQVEATATKVD